MLSFLLSFIVFVVVTFIVGAVLELPAKVTLFGFVISVWWLFF